MEVGSCRVYDLQVGNWWFRHHPPVRGAAFSRSCEQGQLELLATGPLPGVVYLWQERLTEALVCMRPVCVPLFGWGLATMAQTVALESLVGEAVGTGHVISLMNMISDCR